jgi:16S rRNA (cytidine1402-2'-O)-methyltransferase
LKHRGDLPGRLYVVATPIGNLGDLSPRAVQILGAVDLIAAEDTRVSGRLLKSAGISTKMTSYRDENETVLAPKLVARLLDGQDIALICDAGTPTIADPGYRLIKQASGAGVEIVSVPGPSAVTALLSVSGLPTDRFAFEGFLPSRGAARDRAIAKLGELDCTVVVYESPRRVERLMSELAAQLGDPQVAAGRELTKMHEEVLRGTASEVARTLSGRTLKGEFVVAIRASSREQPRLRGADLERYVAERRAAGVSMRDIAADLKERGVPRREVYQAGLAGAGDKQGD